jgi:hypothetical protein
MWKVMEVTRIVCGLERQKTQKNTKAEKKKLMSWDHEKYMGKKARKMPS